MKLSISRDALLKPLQSIIGVVERKQTMPILANVLLVAKDDRLTATATDLEVELVAVAMAERIDVPGEITVPGRKLLDIARALPEGVKVGLQLDGDRLVIKAGRTRFVLSTLPAAEFPLVDGIEASNRLKLPQKEVARLIDKTQFSMAQQDVRYYLNGLMLECSKKRLRAVATDGHRLALCDINLENQDVTAGQVIVPRKGVIELHKLLGDGEMVELTIGSNHIRANLEGIRFTSKLIDGRFPDYERVIPSSGAATLTAEREILRGALQRAAILSNEKYRGVRLELGKDLLKVQANNPDQEEAQDEIEVQYSGAAIEIGFNVTYLLDALAVVDGDTVEIDFLDANSSCLIRGGKGSHAKYVVMPMRL
ncbi:DNA polymerase III subunit beta [Gammaproteobacteria bacterium]|nr:DNA polymerase III subunit beta [Gammaproteobacteria bacterium]CAG0943443.1 DNA polymerase III subunit beta [Gammaproteobacteria bacterium]